jgi:dethiobiotin synthetase
MVGLVRFKRRNAMNFRTNSRRIIFVTGTDTGVGKTLLTALLLQYLRGAGIQALAMKPFCSGGTADVELLQSLQDGELTAREINPFYFSEPVAPLVAARADHRVIHLGEVVRAIRTVSKRCQCLLVEGSGGLLVPLGEGYTVADLITKLECEVLVASRNRLGTINHTLLTVRTLQRLGNQSIRIVLMGCDKRDISSRSNAETLTELLSPTPLIEVPFLGADATRGDAVKKIVKKMKKVLARIAE